MKFFIYFLILVLFPFPSIAETREIEQAVMDAKRDAEKNTSLLTWGALGCGLGIYAFGAAAFMTPQPPIEALIGKTPTYVTVYTSAYHRHAKRRRLYASGVGCAAQFPVSVALLSWAVSSDEDVNDAIGQCLHAIFW